MKMITALFCTLVLLTGCATLQQAKSDIQTGYTTPLGVGEIGPQDEARTVGRSVAGALATTIPFTAPFQMPIEYAAASITGIFLAWNRGRRIRKSLAPSPNPITGYLGNQVGLEGVVQNVSNISAGITEFFKENSSLQHAWQGVLTGVIGLFGTALTVPQVANAVNSHPEIYAWVGGIAGVANAVQQALTKVKPVSAPAPTT